MVNAMMDFWLGQQKAVSEEAVRTWSRMLAVPRVLEQAREVAVGTTPHEVVHEEGTLRLLKYRRSTPATQAEPVLFCYALVNRPYILDLQAGRSVVQHYLDQGFEVYLIDWGVPTAADRSLTLEDYIAGYLKSVADYVVAHSPTSDFHLVGYCMGGTMASIFTALYPDYVKTLTLMAAPIDFGGEESLLQLWTRPPYFDVDSLVDAYGNCPPSFLQACFQTMKPVANLYSKYATLYDKLDDDKFLENYFAMEKWTGDNIPVAGETFREFVKKLYQRNELAKGEFHLGDAPVMLSEITCPLLLLTARADHLVPPSQTERIASLVGSKDVKTMCLEAGHVGLAVSSKAHKTFWPAATRWIAERSSPATDEPRKAAHTTVKPTDASKTTHALPKKSPPKTPSNQPKVTPRRRPSR